MISAEEATETEAAVETTTPAESPETTAPETAAPVTETAAEATERAARARDEKGRFAKADGTPQPEAATAPLDGATPPSPPATPQPQPPAPQAESMPWTFRAGGQRIPIPGAAITPEGALSIPPDQVPAIRQLLGEGMAYRTTFRQREQEWKQQVEHASAEATAKATRNERIAIMLLDKIQDQDWLSLAAQDPREIAYLTRELGLELKSATLAAPRAPVQHQQQVEQDPAAFEHAARATLDDELESLLEGPQARSLYTADERKALQARYQRRLNAYYVEHDGEIVLDRHALKADFDDEVNTRLAHQKAIDDARRAAEFNANRAKPTTVPPVVNSKAPPAPAAASTDTPKSREEWRARMGIY